MSIPALPGNAVTAGEWRPATVRDFPRPEGPSHADGLGLKVLTKEGVDSVHTLGFGFGCTGLGLVRIGEVFE
jgi:hypothetical protein